MTSSGSSKLEVFNLDGRWELSSNRVPSAQEGRVPGCVHSDLLRAGLIPDPNWRTNELDLQWIGKTAWTYRRTFELSEDFLQRAHILLQAHGLDTLATVVINGHEVGRAHNMHRTWEWDVKAHLHAGRNEITVEFVPPDAWLAEKGKINPLEAWNEYYGYRHRGWLRKQHSNFGWDWSPVLVSCGIWKSIRLLGWNYARLLDLRIDQHHHEGTVALAVAALRPGDGPPCRLKVKVFFEHGMVLESELEFPGSHLSAPIGSIQNPRLWWPADLGDQPFYRVRAELIDCDGVIIDHTEKRIGLRTLKLMREPDDHGTSFRFEANGIPFFAKGSNWANPLPYPAWPEGDGWKQLLRDAVLAHHNMIRVWGGAYFCPDEFYDLCDELGLTVWQDFLFACGPYPAFDAEFLANIQAETHENVRRMRHHPCLAIWCGNNELEGAFTGPETTNAKMSLADYDRIFNGILASAVADCDPQGNYWPASPVCTNSDRTQVERGAGDIHIWEVWFSDAPFENYRNYPHRFISEFGFQSMPSLETIKSFTLPEDRQFNSPVLEHHQRSKPGNAQQLKHLLTLFRLPHSFEDQLVLSQLVQALCVKTGVEHWRRNRPVTMGTLYWQLNDCWPCASWSSIDFLGNWKALHYFSARFYAPVLISGLEDVERGTIEIHLSHDLRAPLDGTLSWRVLDLGGRELVTGESPAAVPTLTTTKLTTLTLPVGTPPSAALVELAFHSAGQTVATNLVLLARPKSLDLCDPHLKIEVSQATSHSFDLKVHALAPALWAWLECESFPVRFSDNFAPVLPGRPWLLRAETRDSVTADELAAALRIRSVYSTYRPSA